MTLRVLKQRARQLRKVSRCSLLGMEWFDDLKTGEDVEFIRLVADLADR